MYSFVVLACEVVNARFPEAAVFLGLLSSMEGVWRELHPLITSCVSHSPQDHRLKSRGIGNEVVHVMILH